MFRGGTMGRKLWTKNVLTIALTAAVVSACVLPAADVCADVPSDPVIGTDLNTDTSSYSEEVSVFAEYDAAAAGETTEDNNAGAQADSGTDEIDPAVTDISSGDISPAATSESDENSPDAPDTTSGNNTEDTSSEESSTSSSSEEASDETIDGQLTSDISEPDPDAGSSDVIEDTDTVNDSSDEMPDGDGADTESISDTADLFSLRGSMLRPAAPAKADYEGFEVTGNLSFYITNSEGIRINSWFSEKDSIYYLFVTSGEDLSAMEICFAGVKLDLISKGTIDKKNFVIKGAFSASGEMITLTDYDKKEYKLKVMQSDLPNVMITLNGTDLAAVDSGSKDTKYSGNSLMIINADGSTDLVQDNNVQFKGRGNSTWVFSEKKPYQIKTDKKQSVLEMDKAKKWVLLANAFDDSLMRNKLMFDIAGQMGDWYVCDFKYADVWIDGDYRGNYLIGEKCEIGDNRLDLSEENAVLMELDELFYNEEDYSIFNNKLNQHFTVSDSISDDADVITASINSFNEKVNRLMNLLNYADHDTMPIELLSSYLDVESAAKWYLVNEFAANSECMGTSFFWYTDGDDDVLHLGPVWDFDSALGNKDYYEPGLINVDRAILFETLLNYKCFRDILNSVYSSYQELFAGASALARTIKGTIENSAEMNYTRWDFLGKENTKDKCNPFAATYDEAVDWLASWLDRRYAAFDPDWTDCSAYLRDEYIHIAYINDKIQSATFYIWSNENGQDDMIGLPAFRNAAGNWTASVPIADFKSDGLFSIHVYSGTSLCTTIQTVFEMAPILETELSGQNLEVTLRYHGSNLPVSAGIWSSANGQDDLAWYPLTKQTDGSYKTIVDLGTHKSTGQYYVHLYGRGAYLAGGGAVLESCSVPSVTVSTSADSKSTAEILAVNLHGITDVQAAVWGSKNGQNDLKWYKLKDNGDGTFSAAVDLKAHHESGSFNFHVYGNNGGINEYLDGKSISVSGADVGIPDPSVDALVSGQTLSVILNNAGEYPAARAAVWSKDNGQDDLAWYDMAKKKDGKFTLGVNLAPHKSSGVFIIHIYSGSSFVAGCTVQVDPVEPPYVDVRTQKNNMEISLYNAGWYTSAKAAVWSKENGQDDLVWYTMKKGSDGVYKVTVNPGLHKSTGSYTIHIYSGSTYIAGCSTQVAEIEAPALKVTAKPDDKNKVIISLVNAYGLKNARTAVWGKKNGQNDIKWYTLADAGDGTFKAETDLSAHKETGEFYFHTYADNNGKTGFIDGAAYVFD